MWFQQCLPALLKDSGSALCPVNFPFCMIHFGMLVSLLLMVQDLLCGTQAVPLFMAVMTQMNFNFELYIFMMKTEKLIFM